MVRENTYQSVGNPIQPARLPKRRSELDLPYQPYKPREDVVFLIGLLTYLFALDIVSVLICWSTATAATSTARPSYFLSAVMPVMFGVLSLVNAVNRAHLPTALVPSLLLAGGIVYLNMPLPPFIQRVIAGVALGILSKSVAIHWTSLCTASPLERSLAEQLQRAWRGYITAMALVPTGLMLVLHLLPPAFTCGAVIALGVLHLAHTVAHGHAGRWSVGWRALVSWLTYDRHDLRPPGVWCSPAGSWLTRVLITAASVMALAWVLAMLPANVGVVSQRTSAHAALASSGDTTPAAEASTSLFSIGVPVLFACSIVGPLAAALLVPLALNLPVLVAADACRVTRVTAANWQPLVTSLQQSIDPIERKSIYMGRIAHDGSPLLVSRDTFREHAHFLGDSGAGKTSLGLAPLLEQLGAKGDCSIIVIDLKADSMELLSTLMAAAKQARRRTGRPVPVKYFTNLNRQNTFAFNLLGYRYWRDLELYMRTDILCGALGLTYGADYGQGYYSSANAAVLHHTIKTFPDVSTFRELAERIGYVASHAKRAELHPEIRKAGVHVQTVLDRLGSFEALNVAQGLGYPDEVIQKSIDFGDVFREPEFHYFQLSSTLGPGSSPEIARLATYSLLATATQVQRSCQVFLVIDEFQRMIARNIEYMLQLARSMDVGVILANQTMQDLRTSTADLIPPIESNCRYRQWFSVSSAEDRERLIRGSGETVELLLTRTRGSVPTGQTSSVSRQEVIVPRLTINEVLLASDDPQRSIVRISRGDGYAQYGGLPFVLQSDFHITQHEYQRRKAVPWPSGEAGSFVPGTVLSAADSSTLRPAGPRVTTQIVGGPPAAATAADPFASFMQAGPRPAPRRSRRRKKS